MFKKKYHKKNKIFLKKLEKIKKNKKNIINQLE